jgi:hypothetical protein
VIVQQDLDAVEQDIPRAREELIKCGTQLAGISLEIINDDLKAPFAKLFTSAWDKENLIAAMGDAIIAFFSEMGTLMDPHFYEKLAGWTLAAFVAHYVVRLVNPENVSKVFGVKYAGGFSSRFKLTEDRLRRLNADEMELQRCFARSMSREDVSMLTQALHSAKEMLTNEADILLLTLEAPLRMNPGVSVEGKLRCTNEHSSHESLVMIVILQYF